jgi:hypothetical protein
MITITNQVISPDNNYVLITLSDGSEIAIDITWALILRDDGTTQLQYEIEQAPILANQRASDATAALTAAQNVIKTDNAIGSAQKAA